MFLKQEPSDPRKKLPCDWELDGKKEPHLNSMAAPPTAPPGHNNFPSSSVTAAQPIKYREEEKWRWQQEPGHLNSKQFSELPVQVSRDRTPMREARKTLWDCWLNRASGGDENQLSFDADRHTELMDFSWHRMEALVSDREEEERNGREALLRSGFC